VVQKTPRKNVTYSKVTHFPKIVDYVEKWE